MDTLSQHLMADIWLTDDLTKEHIEHLKNVVETNLTVVEKTQHKFTPQGETIVFILSESHFSVHTYPEEKYLSLDLYICNMTINLEDLFTQMVKKMPILKVEKKIIERGVRPILTTAQNDAGGKIDDSYYDSHKDSHKENALYFLTFFIAFCSIIYELLLAQTLSTTMGNTLLRYNITIGLYIASMGIGALLYSKFNQKNQIKNLIKVELGLSLMGGLAPLSILALDSFFQNLSFKGSLSYFSFLSQSSISIFNYGVIIIVGLLSGAELPILMNMGRKLKKNISGRVLATDYFGTVFGSISFPLFILPSFHLFNVGYLVAFLNTVAATIILVLYKQYQNYKYTLGCVVLLITYFILLITSEDFNQFVIDTFYYLNMEVK